MKEYHYTVNHQYSQHHKVVAESDFEALQFINLKHDKPARVYPVLNSARNGNAMRSLVAGYLAVVVD